MTPKHLWIAAGVLLIVNVLLLLVSVSAAGWVTMLAAVFAVTAAGWSLVRWRRMA